MTRQYFVRICLILAGVFTSFEGTSVGKWKDNFLVNYYSLTIAALANSTDWTLAYQNWSLGSLARVILDNQIAFNYLLAEQGCICTIVNTSCCSWINTSSEVKLELEKIRKIAQDLSSPMSFSNTLWFPANVFSWLPSGISAWLRSRF